ncbi:uncharacterized mitochondrial protein-like protein, partial [Tanacetum coccineum]
MESEDSDEANEKDDSTLGTKIPINPVPVAIKLPGITNYKIIKQGRKGVYQIVRENGTDMVYISFGAMLTDISRDDIRDITGLRFNLEFCQIRKVSLSAEVCKAMLDQRNSKVEDTDEDLLHILKMMEEASLSIRNRPWTCTFLVAKGLATPELMANWVLNFAGKVLTNTEASLSFMGMNSNVENDRVNEVTRNRSTCGSYASTVVINHTRIVNVDWIQLQVYAILVRILFKTAIEFEKMMHKKFQMSSMGELTFFLGLQVKQKEDGIFISQDKYVTEILKKFGFTNVKTASTPMETQNPLLKDENGEEVDVHLYRSMIGSLMYLTSLRPDIMFAVCACARYQVNLKVSHLHAVKRIFRYLKGQPK